MPTDFGTRGTSCSGDWSIRTWSGEKYIEAFSFTDSFSLLQLCQILLVCY